RVAAADPGIIGQQLPHPALFTGVHVNGDDGVRGLWCRFGVGIAGGNVDQTTPRIDGGRTPDAHPGRPEEWHASAAGAARLWLLDRVVLPQRLTRRCIQGAETAAEGAAGVV